MKMFHFIKNMQIELNLNNVIFIKFIIEIAENQLKLADVHTAFDILFITLILLCFSTTIITSLSLIQSLSWLNHTLNVLIFIFIQNSTADSINVSEIF